jgi:hypothetical protein
MSNTKMVSFIQLLENFDLLKEKQININYKGILEQNFADYNLGKLYKKNINSSTDKNIYFDNGLNKICFFTFIGPLGNYIGLGFMFMLNNNVINRIITNCKDNDKCFKITGDLTNFTGGKSISIKKPKTKI